MPEISLNKRLTRNSTDISQLSYEIMFGYVQKLQMAHLIPLKTINIVSYNKFSKPRPGWAGPVFRLNPTKMFKRTLYTHAHTHTQSFYCYSGFCPGPPGWAGTRKAKPEGKTNLDLLEQEIVSGSGICWAICKFAAQPTASKHWRQLKEHYLNQYQCKSAEFNQFNYKQNYKLYLCNYSYSKK